MKIATRGLPLVALAMTLSACAASPDSIKPASIDSAQYAYLTCPQLAQYKATLTAAYDTAAGKEETARTEDAVGLVTLGIPFGSASHKWAPYQIWDLKGRILAVQRVQTADNCEPREAAASS